MIKINRIGYNYIHPDGISVNRPSGSGDYLLLCIKSPSAVEFLNHSYEINEPCFIIFDKGQKQRYFHKEIPFINDWIHFDSDDENIKDFITSLNLPLNEPIFIHNERIISTKIQGLANEFWRMGTHSGEIIDLNIKSLFYSLSDIYHEESKVSDKLNRHRSLFNEIRTDVYSYKEGQKLSVEDYAKRLSLSLSYFQHIYKNLYGVPITHDIIQSRIEYACTLLLSNYDSISDIARRCGYESPEHFTRQFKENTGYTPKQYREEMLPNEE